MPNIETSSVDLDTSHASQKSQEHQQDVLVDELYGQEMIPYNKPTKPAKRSRATKESREHLLDDMLKELDSTLQDIVPVEISTSATVKTVAKSPTKKRATKTSNPVSNSNEIPVNSNVSRPKMIHTQKTRVPVEDGKRKSRTLVTRSAPEPVTPPPPSPASATKTKSRRVAGGKQAPKLDYIEQNTSPAKQTRNSTKTNRDIDSSLAESNLLLELSKKNLNYSPDVVNDLEEILRSPIKSKDSIDDQSQDENDTINDESPSKNTRVSKRIRSRQRQPATHKNVLYVVRQTPTRSSARIARPATSASSATSSQRNQPESTSASSMAVDDELINAIVMNIKHEKEESYTMTSDEFFTCEMCSAVFRDRAQLLVHVPIHI